MTKKIALLGIDLQNDFTTPQGALYVQGAANDTKRIAAFIDKQQAKINYIALTLDSHQPIHIAHQNYWKDEKGNSPNLFTTIRLQDVKANKWMAQYNKELAISYLEQLEAQGEVCTIWPMHCILGSEGWAIDKKLMSSFVDWAVNTGRSYQLLYKGYAQNTEHYSIFKAAVVWDKQPETQLNTDLLDKLNGYDEVILIGQAADFCVASSLNDILDTHKELAQKLILFTDCMSWIDANNERAKAIFSKAEAQGVRFTTSVDYEG